MTREDIERYQKAQHAMQTGVLFMMQIPQPHNLMDLHYQVVEKHLRVGINSSMVDNAALAKLLTEKGIITRDEYEKSLADGMEAEVERYKQMIKESTGMDVNLE